MGKQVRDFAYRVTVDIDGHAEVEFGDVWSVSSDSQVDGNRVIMQLAGQRLMQVAQKMMRSRLADEEVNGAQRSFDGE